MTATNTVKASNGVTLAASAGVQNGTATGNAPAGTTASPTTGGAADTSKGKAGIFGLTDARSKKEASSFMKDVQAFAKAEGDGVQSRAKLARRVTLAAQDCLITEDHAQDVFTAYAKGVAESSGNVYEPSSSLDVQVSKLRAFIRLGGVYQPSDTGHNYETGDELLARAMDVRKTLATASETSKLVRGSTFDFMLTVARKQLAFRDEQIKNKQPEAWDMLSNESIEKIILGDGPVEEREFSEVEKLKDMVVSMGKLRDGSKPDKNGDTKRPACPSEELTNAITWLETRIQALEPDYQTLAQRAEAEAAAKQTLAALGTRKGRKLH